MSHNITMENEQSFNNDPLQGRRNDFGIGGGGQKKFCAALPRKIFFNHTFFSKGYNFVH